MEHRKVTKRKENEEMCCSVTVQYEFLACDMDHEHMGYNFIQIKYLWNLSETEIYVDTLGFRYKQVILSFYVCSVVRWQGSCLASIGSNQFTSNTVRAHWLLVQPDVTVFRPMDAVWRGVKVPLRIIPCVTHNHSWRHCTTDPRVRIIQSHRLLITSVVYT